MDRVPASPLSVQQAIEEVNRVIDSLRESLDDMEGVLETLELAERQKNADEQEIESLRRSLRHMQRPRDGGNQQRHQHPNQPHHQSRHQDQPRHQEQHYQPQAQAPSPQVVDDPKEDQHSD